jgi:hypothetical protein
MAGGSMASNALSKRMQDMMRKIPQNNVDRVIDLLQRCMGDMSQGSQHGRTFATFMCGFLEDEGDEAMAAVLNHVHSRFVTCSERNLGVTIMDAGNVGEDTKGLMILTMKARGINATVYTRYFTLSHGGMVPNRAIAAAQCMNTRVDQEKSDGSQNGQEERKQKERPVRSYNRPVHVFRVCEIHEALFKAIKDRCSLVKTGTKGQLILNFQ